MVSVHVLFDLPDSLCANILSGWLCTDELARLDSACCNRLQRSSFLVLLDGLEVAGFGGGSCEQNIMHMLRWLLARNVKCCTFALVLRPWQAVDASLLRAYIQNVAHCLNAVSVDGSDEIVTVVLNLLVARKCCVTDIEIKARGQVSDAVVETFFTNSAPVLSRICAHLPGKWKPRLARDIAFPALREIEVTIGSNEDLQYLCKPAPNIKVLSLVNPTCTPVGFAAVAVHCRQLGQLAISDKNGIVNVDSAFTAIAPACTNLLQLDVSTGGQLTDTGLTAIVSQCTKLQRLTLSDMAGITDASLIVLAHTAGANLREVHVVGCVSVTGSGVVAIAQHCPNVTVLNLACSTYITLDSLHTALPYLTRIVQLDLMYIVVDDHVLTQIAAHMPDLQSLRLSVAGRNGCITFGLNEIKWQCAKLRVLRLGPWTRSGWTEQFALHWLTLRPNLRIDRS